MNDAPALDISGLKFRYPNAEAGGGGGADRAWVVDVARFTLARGEQCVLTAGSGKGKSTLLNLVAGLMEPTSGTIRIAGTELSSLRGGGRDLFRGRHIGMIFQTFNLLHGFTAAENVMAALMFSTVPPKEHRPRAVELLKKLGIERVDAEVDRLSVGQQQRVAVARAVACAPALVLADEPTASLDPETAAGAISLIRETCRESGAALLCVSHDPAVWGMFEKRVGLGEMANSK